MWRVTKLTRIRQEDYLNSMSWVKRKLTTGKVEPSEEFLKEEKLSFQRAITQVLAGHDIPSELVFNLNQTPLSYVSPGKYTFCSKGSTNVTVKGVDDKRQITATFALSFLLLVPFHQFSSFILTSLNDH